MKPYEVEILVAEVGATLDGDKMYHITYDGTVMDEEGSSVLGGRAEQIAEQLTSRFDPTMSADDAIRLGASVLSANDEPLPGTHLEVAMLVRGKTRRAFRRIGGDELDTILAGTSS
jgi:proteasome alpha subunit